MTTYLILQNLEGKQRKILLGSNEQALAGEFIIGVENNERKGPGDLIANVTSTIGIHPCNNCKRRQQRINKWWFDLTDKLANAMK